jgi:hypothetical protein
VPDSLLITGEISTGNLVAILKILHTRLEELHKEKNESQLCELLQTICPLLDAMIRIGVKGISREQLYTPLYQQFKEFEGNPALAYHAHYAYQALLHIPNDEKIWQEVMRRTFNVVAGATTLANAIRTFNINELINAFGNFSEAFEGVGEIVNRVKELKEGIEDIRQGIEFGRTRQWYIALRFIDLLLQENKLVELEQFVRHSPCNKDQMFLIGLCQRLGKVACTQLDSGLQQGAIRFLVDLYQKEIRRSRHSEVKKWVVAILHQLKNQNNEGLKNYANAMFNKVTSNEDEHVSAIYVPHIMYPAGQVDVYSSLLFKARIKMGLAPGTTEPLAQLE